MKRILAIVAVMVAIGCSDEFNPEVSGPRPFVVFSVLNPALDTQIVRVHQTMKASDPNPRPLPVPGATVEILGPTGTVAFQPVDIPGEPGTSEATIPAFRATPFRPIRGATYTLVVTTAEGIATGTLDVPDFTAGGMNIQDIWILERPHSYELSAAIIVTALLAPQTLGYAFRFQLEYEVFRGGIWVPEVREVPLVYRFSEDSTAPDAVYPTLNRRLLGTATRSTLRGSEAAVFSNRAYEQTIAMIHQQYGSPNVRMRRVVFLLQQADRNFFTYYAFANSFQDRFSIRVDQPDYSNMSGALGFFGCMSIDTLAHPLPNEILPR